MKWRALAPLLVIGVVACAPLDTTRQVCRLMPELESSTVALDRAFSDLAGTDPAVLESSLGVLIDTVDTLRDDPPADIESSLSVIDRTYREIRVALINVSYDGKIAVNDSTTINALASLRRSEVIRATERLGAFVERRCDTQLNAPIPPALGDGATLPTPIQTPDAVEEYPFVVEDEPSSLTAYGYLVASGRNATIDDAEAECVGRSVSNAVQEGGATDDSVLEELVTRALTDCTVTRAPESTVANGAGD